MARYWAVADGVLKDMHRDLMSFQPLDSGGLARIVQECVQGLRHRHRSGTGRTGRRIRHHTDAIAAERRTSHPRKIPPDLQVNTRVYRGLQ